MFEIPIGKAIIAVDVGGDEKSKVPICKHSECKPQTSDMQCMACHPGNRTDGKNVIFKLIDLPT